MTGKPHQWCSTAGRGVASLVACGGRKSQGDRASGREENVTVSKEWMRDVTACKGKQVLSEQSGMVLPEPRSEGAEGKRGGQRRAWGAAGLQTQKCGKRGSKGRSRVNF